jgi:hypothetical protein
MIQKIVRPTLELIGQSDFGIEQQGEFLLRGGTLVTQGIAQVGKLDRL